MMLYSLFRFIQGWVLKFGNATSSGRSPGIPQFLISLRPSVLSYPMLHLTYSLHTLYNFITRIYRASLVSFLSYKISLST